jgi:hypothetical protein
MRIFRRPDAVMEKLSRAGSRIGVGRKKAEQNSQTSSSRNGRDFRSQTGRGGLRALLGEGFSRWTSWLWRSVSVRFLRASD